MCSQYTLYQNIMHGNKCIKEIYLSQAPLKTRGPIFYVEVCFQSQYNARKSKGNRRNRVCLYHLPRNLGQKVEWRTTCQTPSDNDHFLDLENLLNRENRGHKKWRQPKPGTIIQEISNRNRWTDPWVSNISIAIYWTGSVRIRSYSIFEYP